MRHNILAVVGSPRKNGNTHILVSKILEGAGAEGARGDIIFLADVAIRECDGCHACWKGTECSKNDDMNRLYPKIIASDGIVFGTPVYWYGPTALMKGFVDRFVYFNCPEHRVKIRGKPAVLAVPFEEEDPQTAALLRAFFEKSLRYLEMNLIGTLLVPGVSEKGDILEKADRLKEAYDLGRRLVRL
ncbi:MAG: flavodoxin family protein [Deltaproteobacteria bacterium]|nr:flavodoxin family protein [Deltaproteobacteria bacterium]